MTHIPANAEWYLADIIEQITVEGDMRNIVHKNMVLLRAVSPDEAYAKAMALGRGREITYQNPSNKLVRIRFRGLSDLNVIGDQLEDGTEVLFVEKIGIDDAEIAKWIRPKDQLNIFRAVKPNDSPDYSSGEIVEAAKRLIENS